MTGVAEKVIVSKVSERTNKWTAPQETGLFFTSN